MCLLQRFPPILGACMQDFSAVQKRTAHAVDQWNRLNVFMLQHAGSCRRLSACLSATCGKASPPTTQADSHSTKTPAAHAKTSIRLQQRVHTTSRVCDAHAPCTASGRQACITRHTGDILALRAVEHCWAGVPQQVRGAAVEGRSINAARVEITSMSHQACSAVDGTLPSAISEPGPSEQLASHPVHAHDMRGPAETRTSHARISEVAASKDAIKQAILTALQESAVQQPAVRTTRERAVRPPAQLRRPRATSLPPQQARLPRASATLHIESALDAFSSTRVPGAARPNSLSQATLTRTQKHIGAVQVLDAEAAELSGRLMNLPGVLRARASTAVARHRPRRSSSDVSVVSQ